MRDLVASPAHVHGTHSDHRRAGTMVDAFAAVSAVALVGMLTDTWQIVFLTVPLFAVVMMLQGSLRRDGTWDRTCVLAIVSYCAILGGLVIWSVLTAAGDATFWGLPASMAVIVYLIWPYTAGLSGLLYAFVFGRTLVDEAAAAPAVPLPEQPPTA